MSNSLTRLWTVFADGLNPETFWQVHRGAIVRASAIARAHRGELGRITLLPRQHRGTLALSRAWAWPSSGCEAGVPAPRGRLP